MKLRDILNEGKEILEKCKIEDGKHDAESILLNLLDIDMASFLNMCDDELEDRYDKRSISKLITDFDDMIEARSKHFPLQYILGETYFCGMRFLVNDDVLIPRQDTEVLVEKVLYDNPDKNKFVLDMCTGSGCIAISLSNLGGYKVIVGTDISDDAIRVASGNARDLVSDPDFEDEMLKKIYFLQSDLFANFGKIKDELGIAKFDIITANPPYIRRKDIKTLQDEIKKFEPMIALDGDEDGLKFYREIADEAYNYLASDGKIYLEIGYDQAKDVKEIFSKKGYTHIETVKDLGGNDRVIIFKY
ncbi:MAG: peptide chain release factor N(5)-glutamine methyltransferase [Lachnospiraceae bacterium]|nr:peptide chain release factor N(5)-glutamine methyltransferase [Lachnospiraceae bacterium]